MANAIQTFWSALMAGGLLSIGFVAVSAVQWFWVIRGWMGIKSRSLVPLLGGILGFFAIYTSGVPGAMKFCWVPFIVDPGSALMICSALYHAFFKGKS